MSDLDPHEPDPPVGWYPDPAGDARLRWWDGERWTGETRLADAAATRTAGRIRPRHAAPWPRERTIAAGVLGALLLAALTVWGAAVVAGRDGPTDEIAVDDPTEDLQADSPTEPEEDAATDDDTDPPEAPDDGAETADPDVDPAVVDFDGLCAVEVDPAEADDPNSLRPWDFPECERAPIALNGSDGRWIVVVVSLNGDDVTESDALARSQRSDHGLLWSSHYPSLNPGLWVLYEGPFRDEQAATEAADRIGGGSYPRLVSDDEGDRYCIAADGCVGGSGD